ncbi:glycerophosphodiester phosphodiesterase [Actinomycetospora straminea]|uniref:glycerophosphodiester phosphodiesterase n=1 Tax=Actinomycetospora straminea TaxID=663607 RepID=A0ABP9F9Q1_9PSEU|nr:glycerophosphodiester phosphodiesterase [Actinomycetospora straminea]MDD7936612.1 glycerophosphodiester phosphodiesterase [Actinomycetospora straminea]
MTFPVPALSRRSALRGGLAAAGALAAGCADTPTGAAASSPAPPTPSSTPTPSSAPDPGTDGAAPGRITVVGHRGASGYRPEHTLAAYELAIRMGADAVDVDLVPTGDGALVARHEPEIGGTTDIATRPEFAARRTEKQIDGTAATGWFTTDLTLAEVRTLRAVERIPETRPHNTLYDGRFGVVTFDEVLDLLDRLAAELRRPVGVLPEVKHSTYFASLGLPVEPALVDTLRRRGRDREDSGVIIQSFETANLRALKGQVGCPLLQLVDAAGTRPADLVAGNDPRTSDALLTPDGLRDVATYAAWLGPSKDWIVPLGPDDAAGPPTRLVEDAHAAGLRVMPYTFRNENEFLPLGRRRGGAAGNGAGAPPDTYGDAFGEYQQYVGLGVDALFSDDPDTALAAVTPA